MQKRILWEDSQKAFFFDLTTTTNLRRTRFYPIQFVDPAFPA